MTGELQGRTTYRFDHTTDVAAPRERVHALLVDLEHYASWWPQVRAVAKVDDDHALVVCRSVLPYDLELFLTAVDRSTDRLEVGIDGPIRGSAVWRLHDAGPGRTRLEFEQEVQAEATLLRWASWVVRPVLTWNHARMMRGAEEGIRRATRRG